MFLPIWEVEYTILIGSFYAYNCRCVEFLMVSPLRHNCYQQVFPFVLQSYQISYYKAIKLILFLTLKLLLYWWILFELLYRIVCSRSFWLIFFVFCFFKQIKWVGCMILPILECLKHFPHPIEAHWRWDRFLQAI